jgi:hypothetical protein
MNVCVPVHILRIEQAQRGKRLSWLSSHLENYHVEMGLHLARLVWQGHDSAHQLGLRNWQLGELSTGMPAE